MVYTSKKKMVLFFFVAVPRYWRMVGPICAYDGRYKKKLRNGFSKYQYLEPELIAQQQARTIPRSEALFAPYPP